MNLKEIEDVFLLMRRHGVNHFKNLEMEIDLEPGQHSLFEPEPKKESKGPPHAAAAPPREMEIPHHINEVANLLKLNDEALVDKLFPDYTQQAGE